MSELRICYYIICYSSIDESAQEVEADTNSLLHTSGGSES